MAEFRCHVEGGERPRGRPDVDGLRILVARMKSVYVSPPMDGLNSLGSVKILEEVVD